MTRFTSGILRSNGSARRYRGDDCARTPLALFHLLDREFGFTLDAAATPESALCARYFTPETDALTQPWAPEIVWCNPPYRSDLIGCFIAKGWEESRRGATCVFLVPVRADVGWWHDFALLGEIRFIRGRLRFREMPGTAPFASCLVIFRPNTGRDA